MLLPSSRLCYTSHYSSLPSSSRYASPTTTLQIAALLRHSHSALSPHSHPVSPAAATTTATAGASCLGARVPFCTLPPLPPIIPTRSPAMPSGPPPRRARAARMTVRRSWPAKPSVRWGPWAATQVLFCMRQATRLTCANIFHDNCSLCACDCPSYIWWCCVLKRRFGWTINSKT